MAIRHEIDVTGNIGPLYVLHERGWSENEAAWPMYSYEHPASIVWNTIANVLHERGWSEAKIKNWLQSKDARWALDGELGDALTNAAEQYAREHI
jgi:uncharacterized membrane protein